MGLRVQGLHRVLGFRVQVVADGVSDKLGTFRILSFQAPSQRRSSQHVAPARV